VAVRLTVTVNGETRTADDVWPGESLLFTLRERLGLPGTKNACEQGECGSCTVLLDDEPVCACLVAAPQAQGRTVVTVEGLAGSPGSITASNEAAADPVAPTTATAGGGTLHPVQAAFVATGAVQCGFCTPGLVVAVVDLLRRQPHPSDSEIREALSGNLCRCTGYEKILDAVRLAADQLAADRRDSA
jgi:carbon-monoxide dehydrogenase small subunit